MRLINSILGYVHCLLNQLETIRLICLLIFDIIICYVSSSKLTFCCAVLALCLFMFMCFLYMGPSGLVVYYSWKGNTDRDKGDKNVHLLTMGCM